MGKTQTATLRKGYARNRYEGTSRRRLRATLVGAGLALSAFVSAQTTAFNATRAFADLKRQCEFGFRIPGTKPHDDCRDWLKAELAKSCDNVFFQNFSHTWSVTGKTLPMDNIVGEINWKDATTRVCLFAHWDTRPMADQDKPENQRKPLLGANDGASGVAVLLELARVLKASPLDKRLGVRIVLIDGEDLGPGSNEMYLGSILYAKSTAPKGDYGILLDMIGDKDLEVPIEPNSYDLVPGLTRAIYAHAKSVGLGKTFPSRLYQYAIEDDHLPLIQGGIPTIDLIDFEYKPWHTVEDTPDKCSPDSLLKVGILLETWLRKNPTYKPTAS